MRINNSRYDSIRPQYISMRKFLKLTCVTAAGLMAGNCSDGGPETTLALINGTLIDGTGADAVSDGAVVIQGDRIAAVGPRSLVEIPANADIIDVKGKTGRRPRCGWQSLGRCPSPHQRSPGAARRKVNFISKMFF